VLCALRRQHVAPLLAQADAVCGYVAGRCLFNARHRARPTRAYIHGVWGNLLPRLTKYVFAGGPLGQYCAGSADV